MSGSLPVWYAAVGADLGSGTPDKCQFCFAGFLKKPLSFMPYWLWRQIKQKPYGYGP